MAEEQIIFTQVEDGIASFERKDGEIVFYLACNVPAPYKEGDIIRAIVNGDDDIEFIDIDHDAMVARSKRMINRAARLRARAHRTTNME